MAISARVRKFGNEYEEKVYAGLVGKRMGAGLGARHSGQVRTLSAVELGKIGYDLEARSDLSSVFADESLVTALISIRALEDFPAPVEIESSHIAQTWLNYAIENRAMLWWGGRGNSAEHSAYLNLNKEAPASYPGDAGLSPSGLVEQSGGEACADVWGLVCPGDVERAMHLAGKCARVSHSGEAIFTAQAAAGFVAAAFYSSNSTADIVGAVERILPPASAVAKLIVDIREWSSRGATWSGVREGVLEKYIGGVFHERHAVPHFAGVVMALLLGEGDLTKSLTLAASAGWGSAANMGIIGCVLGAKNGMAGIDVCGPWRSAVEDPIVIPSADAGRCLSDLATEALNLCNMGRAAQRAPTSAPKKGARFHFELPGSCHGFNAELSSDSPGLVMLRNVAGHSRAGKRGLALVYSGVEKNRSARLSCRVFDFGHEHPERAIHSASSPTLYPGQTIRAYVEANAANKLEAGVRPFIRYLGENDQLQMLRGPEKWLLPDSRHEFQWTLPHAAETLDPAVAMLLPAARESLESESPLLLGRPIAEVGLEIFSDKLTEGVIYLDYVTWGGSPCLDLGPPHGRGEAWKNAWVNAATQCAFSDSAECPQEAAAIRVCQNSGTGLLIQGARHWRDYSMTAKLTIRSARSAGIAIRVQGLQRYYALMLSMRNKLRLIKQFYGANILAETEFDWACGQTVELSLTAEGRQIVARADGREIFKFEDATHPFDGGACALVVEEGCLESAAVRISGNP